LKKPLDFSDDPDHVTLVLGTFRVGLVWVPSYCDWEVVLHGVCSFNSNSNISGGLGGGIRSTECHTSSLQVSHLL